ncbi:MAG: S-layer homology domain-containing protein [Candidatus Sericytochromatia bacterium]|nr:S-layer homology domain-containing protein [Candidatus Sericytochromatia bacterium]
MLALSRIVLATALISGAPVLSIGPAWAAPAELRDVPADHWAIPAIVSLTEKYGILSAYPDKTFRGGRNVTRYELAATLAKLLQVTERRIAIATGTPVPEPGIAPEDLRTIARLQREFREELDTLRERADKLENRVRVLEKGVRVKGRSQADFRSWQRVPNAAFGGTATADIRLRQSLDFDAELSRGIHLSSTLNADLYSPSTAADSFLRGTATRPAMDLYLPRLMMKYHPVWVDYRLGLGALRENIAMGSAFTDPFQGHVWRQGSGGFGFVGTPGLNSGPDGTLSFASTPSGVPAWLPGTGVVADILDPNNSSLYAPHGDILSSARFVTGPVNFGLALSRSGLSGPLFMGGTPIAAGSLPALAIWQNSPRAVGTLGLDYGMLHLRGLITGPTDQPDFATRNKAWAAGIDLGEESLALSAEILGQGSFNPSDIAPQRASLRLGSSNLFDLGLRGHLGWVSGQLLSAGSNATNPGTVAGKSIFTQADYQSLGIAIQTPPLFIIPSVTIAMQQTGGGIIGPGAVFSSPINSGVTVQTALQLFELPEIQLEYSRGKFGTQEKQGIFDASPFSHDQLSCSTRLTF